MKTVSCRIEELSGKLNCQLLSGEVCHCKGCGGSCILDTVKLFTKLFLAMRTGELILQIETEAEDE